MGICEAHNVTLRPFFHGDIKNCGCISKANVGTVQFEVADNCPHVEKLRDQGLIPWASATIDFLNGRQ